MADNWSLLIRVVDPNDRPVDMASVTIRSSPTPVPDIGVLTNTDGLVELSVPSPGAYELQVHAPGFSSQVFTLESTVSGKISDIHFTR